MTSAVAEAAVTSCPPGCVYIVKGTNSAFNQIPDSAYPQFAHNYDTAVGAPAPLPVTQPYPYYLVQYPASFWPITPPGYIFSPTFDQSVAEGVRNLESVTTGRPISTDSPGDVLWGYSQGATVVTQYKRDYNAQTNPPAKPPTFVLVANPNRPNGGILERGVALGTIPILGVTFSGATPTTTATATGPSDKITTYDIARQYDGVADAPVNPLNVIADANAAMGFFYLHGKYPDINPAGPNLINQGTYGDTQYYLIATYPLPLLMPLESIPVIGFPLADTLDPPLRVIVESAYDRTTPPGVPTPANPLYFPNPATFANNLLVAIPTGLDNGISDLTGGNRPLGTTRPGAFGVTQGSTPLTPVLFSSPGGGVLALRDPTRLLANPTTMNQWTNALNPGLSVGVPSLLNSTGDAVDFRSVAGQSPTGANKVLPGTDPGQQWAPHGSLNEDGTPGTPSSGDVPGSATNIAAQQPQSPKNNPPTGFSSGPRLNVFRPPQWAAPGSKPGNSSTDGSSSTVSPTVKGPIGSAVSDVASSIKSALGGLSKRPTGGDTK